MIGGLEIDIAVVVAYLLDVHEVDIEGQMVY
jgi:hypothetical protein